MFQAWKFFDLVGRGVEGKESSKMNTVLVSHISSLKEPCNTSLTGKVHEEEKIIREKIVNETCKEEEEMFHIF
jgi:hypothetical protein